MKLVKLAVITSLILFVSGKKDKQILPGASLMPDSVAYGYATNDNYALQNAAVRLF